jgi:hypothetical protein
VGATAYVVDGDPNTDTADELALLSILNTSAMGNFVIALEHQVIAAQLNLCNGAQDDCNGSPISAVIAAANQAIVNGAGNPVLSAYNNTLTAYNEGVCGPGHCP